MNTIIVVKQEPQTGVETLDSKFSLTMEKGVEKDKKRRQANKKSAQQSRERKKALKGFLEEKLSKLSAENTTLSKDITELEAENKVLKREFVSLHRLITDSNVLSKLAARANLNISLTNAARLEAIQNNIPTPAPLINPNTSPTSQLVYLMMVLYSFRPFFPPVPEAICPVVSLPQLEVVA